MKFMDSRPFMALIFLITLGGCIVVGWATLYRIQNHKNFSWELTLFGLYWLWAVYSTGKRLFKRRNTEYNADGARPDASNE